jgi:hypothetical protein
VFQLSAFQSNAFQIGWPSPTGGYRPAPHERVIRLTEPATEPAKVADIQPEAKPDRTLFDGLARDRARIAVAKDKLDAMDRAALIDEILLLEFNILDSHERKRLANDAALCLLLLSDY